ncbi:nacht wd [Fusarium napiforme]|uniref:Nacht wd n=1 Tax=Fusarium napiforme TaxID=42672 RepID=A0A8H5NES9_9HYPO|nr:nacht wd [Fusarium napiforme]
MLDDDLANVCESRMPESCEWISNKDDCIKWKDGEEADGTTLWIKGRPATGKSVLAGYVVDQLRESGQICSYFFFKHGDRSKAYLGLCLRRLAFQRAASNVEASDTILKMQADGISFDGIDERTLWRMLFLPGIFRVPMARQYWVTDALDECSNPLAFLQAILPTMDESIPLWILVTSRDTVELDQGFAVIPVNMVQILTDIHQILEDVPRGMESLYKRALDYMSHFGRGKELAKTILVWAACAVRPMTIGELDGALTLDIQDTSPNLEATIAALCGQLVIVDKQGRSNVLTWIEAIADSQDLTQLVRASKHLKAYMDWCVVERSPLDPQMRALRQWSMDLARIPAMFANALAVSPSAIYSLIPPFCPTESMIYKVAGSNQRLEVLGTFNEQWDDRILCVDFRTGQLKAVRYGDGFLAIALGSGTVILYYTASHQEYKTFGHGESVNLIAFKTGSDLMATCGIKTAKIWDIRTGQVVHTLVSPPRPLGMEFDGDMLLISSRNNCIGSWKLGHNVRPESVRRPWGDANTPEANRIPLSGVPCALALSTSHCMLAVAYNGQPSILWDMEEDTYAGSCGKKLSNGETSTHVIVALAVNPNPDIGLLAVAYLDGDLALLDPYADRQLECFRANCQTLAPSPN